MTPYADWCRQKSNLPDATRHTVEALLEEAGTKNCTQANQNLIRISNRLDLANKQISDLSPLSSLTNLYRVHLEDNQIKDLRPLSELTQLYSLYLTNNQVKNLQPLSKISGLGKLYLGNNQIEDLQPLSKLANSLALLVLNNNKISDPQPLAKLTVIDYIDLSGNQIRDIKSLEPISSLNITLFENPVLGSSQYVCYTGKFYVDVSTNSGGQLVYKSFTGNYNYNNPPHGRPDLILYNGKIISSKKHISHGTYNTIETSTVTNWTNPGGFIYQIHHYEQTEGADPGAQSGTLTVFQKGRKIYEGACQFDD